VQLLIFKAKYDIILF